MTSITLVKEEICLHFQKKIKRSSKYMQYARARNFIFENVFCVYCFLLAKYVLFYLLEAYTNSKKYLKDVHI
jgi:hypothetical protein